MIYARLLSMAILPLVGLYYILVVLQCFGLVRFSREKITFPKVLIPFYYFFT